ncbi:MAG: phosphoribosylamine--glycine ligase, partial [Bacteroidetes bacterium QS_1_65_9]
RHATRVDLDATDAAAVADFAEEQNVDLAVVGPEQPLVDGVSDHLRSAGVGVVGPSAEAARLEGSKAFAKSFMSEHGIPTASHRTFTVEDGDEEAYEAARRFLTEQGAPVVVKASGLAGGKGAFVCSTEEEAQDALRQVARERRFGDAGDRVVIEECMDGVEASVFALTDGERYALMAPAQDHKRIGEGGTGPNTGGMGAYAPTPVLTERQLRRVEREVVAPTLEGMAERGAPYQGVLYCGLMLTDEGPKVVEYNCRLGDPEAQVVLPLLSGDLVEVFDKLASGRLGQMPMHTFGGAAACVVLASEGYPTDYETGVPIEGVEEAEAEADVTVFHAGTARTPDGRLVTDGGRVLGVTAQGPGLEAALDTAYRAADKIQFEGKTYRR